MRLSLATKFSVTILGVVALAILSSLVTLYAAWRVNIRLDEARRGNLLSVRAEEVEIAILEGNNLLASGVLGKADADWEKTYRGLEPRYQCWIPTVRETIPLSEQESALLVRLDDSLARLDARSG